MFHLHLNAKDHPESTNSSKQLHLRACCVVIPPSTATTAWSMSGLRQIQNNRVVEPGTGRKQMRLPSRLSSNSIKWVERLERTRHVPPMLPPHATKTPAAELSLKTLKIKRQYLHYLTLIKMLASIGHRPAWEKSLSTVPCPLQGSNSNKWV